MYENERSLGITLSWFTPVAFFLLFFSIAWDGFLIFWYSMAFSGPWIMALFPVVHVAVGFYLTYYTLCLFFNKTFIDVEGDTLTVVHKPIPWWRGNRKFDIRDITQFYVAEKKSTGQNGVNYIYELRAKLRSDSETEVVALDGVSSQDVLRIEEHLEKFLGINDMPVKGEYGKTQVSSKGGQPRRQVRNFSDPSLGAIYFSKEGSLLSLKNESLETVSVTQFDWNDGNSDKSFQLVNPKGEERLIYLEQNKALLHAYQERELNLFETNLGKFPKADPPASILVDGTEYFPTHSKVGKYFVAGNLNSLEVKQWQYSSRDQQAFIRVVSFQNSISLFKGEIVQASDFGDSLDLNYPPQRDSETRTNDWNEEDLV